MISEFPLFLFTTLGGLAAGTYVAVALFVGGANGEREARRPWALPLACLVLLGVGLLGVLGHLGRPERFLLALSNPSAMIAEEAYWSIAFGVLMLVDFISCVRKGAGIRGVRILSAVAAIGLIGIMAWAYFTAYGNPAWATWQTLLLFVAGDLAMGAALYALFDGGIVRTAAYAISAAVLDALTAVSFAMVGAHFAAVGLEVVPFAVAAVLAALGMVAVLLAWKGKLPAKAGALIAFALMLAGVAAARYAFYAASIL